MLISKRAIMDDVILKKIELVIMITQGFCIFKTPWPHAAYKYCPLIPGPSYSCPVSSSQNALGEIILTFPILLRF